MTSTHGWHRNREMWIRILGRQTGEGPKTRFRRAHADPRVKKDENARTTPQPRAP